MLLRIPPQISWLVLVLALFDLPRTELKGAVPALTFRCWADWRDWSAWWDVRTAGIGSPCFGSAVEVFLEAEEPSAEAVCDLTGGAVYPARADDDVMSRLHYLLRS